MFSPAPKSESEKQALQLIQRLARLKRNWPSEPALKNLSPMTVTALLQHLATHKKMQGNIQFLWAICYFIFYIGFEKFTHDHRPLMLVFPVCLCLSLLWIQRKQTKRYTIFALTQTNDMRALSPLLASTSESYGRHPKVIGAIKRFLARITEEQIGLLNNEAQTRLWYFAVSPVANQEAHDLELGLLALQTLARIGNKGSLKKMQNFMDEPAVYPDQRRAHKALQQLLPGMEARLKRQEVPQTLLRASDMPASPPETLLRAAYASDHQPAEQLLRASRLEERET